MGAPCSTCRRGSTTAEIPFKEPDMRSVGMAESTERHLLPGQPVDSRPFNANVPYQASEHDQIREIISALFAPRLACYVAVTFGVFFILASIIIFAALMPNETTTTTTTTTTQTMTTTTTLTTTTGTTTTLPTAPPPTAPQVPATARTPSLRSSSDGATQAVPPPPPPPTTSRQPTSDVDVSMRVQHLDYARLKSQPELRAPLEDQVRFAISSEAGHGVKPDDVLLRLQAGSVVVKATIHSLPEQAAQEVSSGLRTSSTLGPKVAAGIQSVWGVDAVATGPLHVTEISAYASGGTAAARSGGLPAAAQFTIVIGVICLLCALAVLLFLLWRRRSSKQSTAGYTAATVEEPKPAAKGAAPSRPSPGSSAAQPKMGKQPLRYKSEQALSAESKEGDVANGTASAPARAVAKQGASSASMSTQPSGAQSPAAESGGAAQDESLGQPVTGPTPSAASARSAQDGGAPPSSPPPAKAKSKAKAKAKAAQQRRAASGVSNGSPAAGAASPPPAAKAPAKASANAPAPKAGAPAASSPSPQSSFLQTAVDMGFSQDQARQALAEADGNEENAMEKLLRS